MANDNEERSYLLHSATAGSHYDQPLDDANRNVSMSRKASVASGCSFFKTHCPFQDFSVETNSVAVLQAAVFVEDAINYRSIHHKIDPVLLNMFYRPYYTRIVQYSINVFIAIYLLLAFFEKPSSLHWNSDYRDKSTKERVDPPCGITEGIEFLCLFIFTIDALVQFKLIGWHRFIRRPWLVLYAFLIIASGIDLIVSLGSVCGYTIRVRRLLRPVFLLQRSSIMKKMINAIKKSLPQILSVLVLLLLVLYVFAMLGLLLFHERPFSSSSDSLNSSNSTDIVTSVSTDNITSVLRDNENVDPHSNYTAEELEGHLYFDSFAQAFVSLLVLLTTANNPDSMLPVYTANRFYAIYFIVFVALCTYIMLNLLTAVIYNQFRGYLNKSLQSSFFRRRVGLRAAFIVLSVRKRDPRNGLELEIIHVDTIRRLLHNVRMKKKYLPLMINMLETMDTNYFSWVQFRALFDILGKKTNTQSSGEYEGLSHIRWYARFQLVVRHRYFMYFTHFVSVMHALFITVELIYDYDKNFAHHDSDLMIGNFCFIIYYVLELIVKLLALGKRYLKQLGNIYEGIVTLVLLGLMIMYIVRFGSPIDETSGHRSSEGSERMAKFQRVIRVITIFVILRLLRIVPHIQRLYLVVATVIDLISHLRGFMGIIVAVYYFFAILGMQLFADNYKFEKTFPSPSQCTDQLLHDNKCTEYQQLSYYANNFHDFGAALVVLWDVMVVNNWYIFLKGYRWMTGTPWAQLYFIAWWLVSVIICVNLFVALVLEAFVSRWERVQRQESAELYSSIHMNTVNYDQYNYQQHDSVQTLLQEQLVEPDEADIMHELQKHRDMILYANF